MRWWPRSIRWQMVLGLVIIEVLYIALFAILLIRAQELGVTRRIFDRLSTSPLLSRSRPRKLLSRIAASGSASPSASWARLPASSAPALPTPPARRFTSALENPPIIP